MRRSFVRGGLLIVGAAGTVAAAAYYSQRLQTVFQAEGPVHVDLFDPLPARPQIVNRLSRSTRDNPFDVLVIGGGATGAGCALDASTRGLDVALIEQADFGAGTSSRSTKLVHGGVRYLEKAVFNVDPRQLKLVFEALQEREVMLRNAPHLAHSLPILTPCYNWWEVPYYWAGLKAYDLVAGVKALTWSHYVSPRESLRQFPTLSPTHLGGDYLKGAVVYYDGQFDDARYNVSIAITAALAGAAVANYTKAVRLIKDGSGSVIGARVKDQLSQREYDIYARVIINATGPFTDDIRHMADKSSPQMVQASAGAHVTLPDYYAPGNLGMIVPKTKDGRVVFLLPWQNHAIAGTTDAGSEVSMTPQASEKDVQFILDAIAEYLAVKVQRSDVLSAWSGLRPLPIDPAASDTQSVVRDHLIVNQDGVITVTGGKWTTYRKMAEETIDAACSSTSLPYCKPCVTKAVKLIGSTYWYPTLYTEIAQKYTIPGCPGSVDSQVARHLADSYGDRSQEVVKLATDRQLGNRLVPAHPILEAEVLWAVQNEFCEKPEDFLARRSRLVFVDKAAAELALPKVANIMAKEKGWSYWRKRAEIASAKKFLETFDATATPPPPSPAPQPVTPPPVGVSPVT